MRLYDTISPHLSTAARERLSQTPVRVFLTLFLALLLYVIDRSILIGPWLVVACGVIGFEFLALKPFRAAGATELTRHSRMLPALAAVVLMSTAFAAAAGLIWVQGGLVAAAIALLMLAGGLVNNIASGIESRALFLIGATPYLAVLTALPFTRLGFEPSLSLTLLCLAVALFFLGVLGVWARVHAVRASELRALAETQTRLEQAEAAMADRAAMAAIVSHELRTPISAILAGAHVIRQGDRPEQTADTAELIMDAGRLMTGMLNDLLDHSKIEARAMTVEVRDFDLSAFLAEARRFWNAAAEQKGLTLAVRGPSEPLWLKGDPFRLRQIVNNLMSNAVKFTPAGRIELTAQTQASDGSVRLRLSVRDQGPGIPAEAMDRLFTPFAQGSSEVARTYGGTGLGLTVSRELARLMGGDLVIDSDEGPGACFLLEVVLPVGAAVMPDDGQADASPVIARRLRVLAVDDHEINRRTLALVLQPLDIDLTLASDGLAALERLTAQPFDVVLMDVNMPGIDGNETTRRLRASDGCNARIPVIGFSAGTEPAQIQACMDAGMTDWLAKPLEPAWLYAALERAMRTQRSIEAA